MKAAKAVGATVCLSRSRAVLTSEAFGRSLIGALFGGATAVLVLASTASAADNRTLDLYNAHTQERLTITFKKNGRFVPSALTELNRFLRDWRRNEAITMDPRLFDTVWELYQKSGSRQPIHVVCGYRSLATNNLLRSRSSAVAKKSQHTLGRAMDMNIPDVSINKLRAIAVQMQNGGVGWYPSANSPFVHIDVGSVRAWPRLTRTQLVGLFPDGKTAHIPADGKPLPGYQQALADLQSEKGATSVAMASTASAGGSTKGGGLLAMLFAGDEDSSEEISAADGGDDAPAAKLAPASPAPAVVQPPVATAKAAPPAPAPVLTVAFAPRPPAMPDRPVTSLADATLPAELEPAALPALSGADRIALDVPLPLAKPDDIGSVDVAMADMPVMLPPAKPAAPIAAPLPPVNATHEDAIAAQLALAEVAKDGEPSAPLALSFAGPATEPVAKPRPPVQMASIEPTPRQPIAAPADATVHAIIDGGKSDMVGNIELPVVASEDGPSLLDGGQSVYWGHFRSLSHPDQRHLAQLFEAPVEVAITQFTPQPYGDMVSTRFTGHLSALNAPTDAAPARLFAMR